MEYDETRHIRTMSGIEKTKNNKIMRYCYAPYQLKFAAETVKRIAARYCDNFKLNPEEQKIYVQFIKYLHGDSTFEGDLNKGIAVIGPTGTGKTLLFKIMEDYRAIDDILFWNNGRQKQLSWIKPYLPDKINMDYVAMGDVSLNFYTSMNVLYLDDLGVEKNDVKHYGNELSPIEQILTYRHRVKKLTFFSSNLNKDGLQDKYEDRLFSRMHEMFNFIEFNTGDKRML